VYAPGGANAGDVSNVTVTITDAGGIAPSGCGTQSNINTTTVVTGSLTVYKTQATLPAVAGVCPAIPASGTMVASNIEAAPGDCIYYQVVATNNGAAPVANVSLSDAAPAYTTLQSTPAPTCTTSESDTVAAAPSGSTLSCGTVAELSPLGTVTLRFAVRISAP
jgi:trimeric autotransporter adhesin